MVLDDFASTGKGFRRLNSYRAQFRRPAAYGRACRLKQGVTQAQNSRSDDVYTPWDSAISSIGVRSNSSTAGQISYSQVYA